MRDYIITGEEAAIKRFWKAIHQFQNDDPTHMQTALVSMSRQVEQSAFIEKPYSIKINIKLRDAEFFLKVIATASGVNVIGPL